MQVVALGAGDAHRFALDARLHLHLAVLDHAHDLFGIIGLDTVLDLDDLLDLVAANLLDIAVFQETDVNLALGQLVGQHVAHLAQLELGIGKGGQFVVLLLDPRVAALEIEPGGDFLVGLVDRVFHFDHIGFRNYIKRRHGYFLFVWHAGV